MLAMLCMGSVNMLPVTGVSSDRLIIFMAVGITADSTILTGCCVTIVSSCCTLVRGWLLSLVCTGIASVRGSVPLGTTSIASVATSYLALLRLFVGAFMCLAPADTGTVVSMVFGRTGPAPVSIGNVSCAGLPGLCSLLALVAFLFSRPSYGRFTLLFLRYMPGSFLCGSLGMNGDCKEKYCCYDNNLFHDFNVLNAVRLIK